VLGFALLFWSCSNNDIRFLERNNCGIQTENEEKDISQKLHEICSNEPQEKLREPDARRHPAVKKQSGVLPPVGSVSETWWWYHLHPTRVSRGKNPVSLWKMYRLPH